MDWGTATTNLSSEDGTATTAENEGAVAAEPVRAAASSASGRGGTQVAAGVAAGTADTHSETGGSAAFGTTLRLLGAGGSSTASGPVRRIEVEAG